MRVLLKLIFLFPTTIFAQVELHNLSLTDSTQKILYIGISNHIEITGLSNYSNLKIISSKGTVYSIKDQLNCFNIVNIGKGNDTITIFQNDVLISTSIFECRRIPNPIPKLGNITDSIASVDEILKDPTLKTVLPECYLKPYFALVGFRVVYWRHKIGNT